MSLREQLTAIYEAHGELTPKLVVATASPKDHPLHKDFEWDDKIAGPRYREVQAAQLIRSVKVMYSEAPADPKSVRGFHSVTRADSTSYVPVEEIVQDDFMREVLLRQMRREWSEFQRRYQHLEEFAALVNGVAQAVAS